MGISVSMVMTFYGLVSNCQWFQSWRTSSLDKEQYPLRKITFLRIFWLPWDLCCSSIFSQLDCNRRLFTSRNHQPAFKHFCDCFILPIDSIWTNCFATISLSPVTSTNMVAFFCLWKAFIWHANHENLITNGQPFRTKVKLSKMKGSGQTSACGSYLYL